MTTSPSGDLHAAEEWIWKGSGKRKRDESDSSDDESTFFKYCRLDFTNHRNQEQDSLEQNTSIQVSADQQATSRQPRRLRSIRCTITPSCCKLPAFDCIPAYEEHYQQHHEMVCNECQRILPSAHLLDLHLCEVHDSFFAVLAQNQHMYSCFVDGCQRKSQTPKSRIRHLIEKHKYPRKFDFDVVLGYSSGSFKHKSYRKKQSKKQPHKAAMDMDVVQETTTNETNQPMDLTMDTLTSSLSKLAIPRSVSFHHRQKKKPASFLKIKEIHSANAPHVPHPPPKVKNLTSSHVSMSVDHPSSE